MGATDSIRDLFFEECDELLEALTDGLQRIADGTNDDQTIHVVFRAVHSIKGGAGAFGLSDLVAFAHTFETLLARIREGDVESTAALVRTLQRSGDVLADLVEAAHGDQPYDRPVVAALTDELVVAAGKRLEHALPAEDEESAPYETIALDIDLWDLDAAEAPEADAPSAPSAPELEADEIQHPSAGSAANPRGAWVDVGEDQAAAPLAQTVASSKPRATLRVDVERVERLMSTVGELIINQAMVTQHVQELGVPMSPEFVTELDNFKQYAREIQEGVMALRTQPVRQLFQRMQRITREASDRAGKPAHLVVSGEDTEVDKKVIEKLADPLTHMIRNAIDHGLEPADQRRRAGKPAEGEVRLTASHKSGDVLIQISDDGGGLDRQRIRQTAINKGLISRDADLSDGEIDQLLFRPGFSTAASTTELSGRGVGMDVVKTEIAALGGRVSIASTEGVGSTFSIVLPLTLAVVDGMVVRVGQETMIVPVSSVEEATCALDADLGRLGPKRLLFSSRGDQLPVIDVSARLGFGPSASHVTDQTLLLIQTNGARFALAVDEVLGKRQVVIKSLSKNYRTIPGVSAATILGDGQVALIIDPDTITDEHLSFGNAVPERSERSDAA